MSINRVNISGNLTRDAELKTSQSGNSILSFGVAVNDRRKDPNTGEWTDYPNFVDVTIFGNRANALATYLLKGTKVAIDGKLRFSSWEKNGERRSKLEVIAEDVEFLSSRNDQQRPAPQVTSNYAPSQQYAAPATQYAPPTAQMPQAPAYQPQQTFYPNQAPMQYTPDLADESIPF